MSRLNAIGRGALAVGSAIGGISTVTGHGAISVVAAAFKIRVPPRALAEIAKYQFKSAEKNWEKASEEWDKED